MNKEIGIYSIINVVNGKINVGQSKQLTHRLRKHKSLLRGGTHFNSHLQSSWDKYGEDAFEFNVLEYCDKEYLDAHERWWIAYFDSTNREKGYNIEDGGCANKSKSVETIKKISETQSKTGIFRVGKHLCKKCKKGYIWRYSYREDDGNRIEIARVDLNSLKQEVLNRGLLWHEFEEGGDRECS